MLLAILAVVIVWDLTQRRHSILRTWPILGHFRFIFEAVGPELRQYIVTDNDSERPFSRDQRRWIYSTSKGEDNRFAFGTDNDLDRATNHLIIRPTTFPPPGAEPVAGGAVPVAKILGASRGRTKAFRPRSIVNVSGMSWGALSGPAVESLNRGAAEAGALHGTGEGGISSHHQHGGELILQIGSGYFGCRDSKGRFDLPRLVEVCEANPVRALEIKLSQGAKPGVGGLLPAAKVTAEIARVRGVPPGVDCASPPYHSAFSDEDSLLDFVERIAEATGLPVGIKSAVGDLRFWERLVSLMASGERGVDFIVIDGGEGGTGAAPLVVHRPCRDAVHGRVRRGFTGLRHGGNPRSGRLRGLGPSRPSPAGDRGDGARLRLDQRRPRGDALGRLHPGAALPHRELPLGRGHAVEVADARR